jgi:hypothetical protein
MKKLHPKCLHCALIKTTNEWIEENKGGSIFGSLGQVVAGFVAGMPEELQDAAKVRFISQLFASTKDRPCK